MHALGERKTRLFRQALQQGIDPEPGAESLLKKLRQMGVGIAVASSSKNCSAILSAAGFDHLIDARVDGVDADELRLPGKPDPALFLEAARRLRAQPSRTILFEDALAGCRSWSAGWFWKRGRHRSRTSEQGIARARRGYRHPGPTRRGCSGKPVNRHGVSRRSRGKPLIGFVGEGSRGHAD